MIIQALYHVNGLADTRPNTNTYVLPGQTSI